MQDSKIKTQTDDFSPEFLEKIRKMNKEADIQRKLIFEKAINDKKNGIV